MMATAKIEMALSMPAAGERTGVSEPNHQLSTVASSKTSQSLVSGWFK
jgi:hypothetical protein